LVFFNFEMNSQSANLCTIAKEIDPGNFLTFHLCNDINENITSQSEFSFDYDEKKLRPLVNNSKNIKITQDTQCLIRFLTAKPLKTVEDKFCLEILKPENFNTVWLSLNADNFNLSIALKILTEFNFSPNLVKRTNNLILLKLKCQDLLFINLSNYFSGTTYDLIKQFDLNIDPYFFPCDKNLLHLNPESAIPHIDYFYTWQDNDSLLEMKTKFYNKKNLNLGIFGLN